MKGSLRNQRRQALLSPAGVIQGRGLAAAGTQLQRGAGSRLIRRHVNRKPKRPGRASRRRGEGGTRLHNASHAPSWCHVPSAGARRLAVRASPSHPLDASGGEGSEAPGGPRAGWRWHTRATHAGHTRRHRHAPSCQTELTGSTAGATVSNYSG